VAKPTSTRTKMRPPAAAWVVAIGLLVALVIFSGGLKFMQIGKMMSMKPPVPVETVTSAVAKEEDWAPVLSSVGSISAVQGAVVSTELGGIVSEIGFQNGTLAKKGDLLVKLDASAGGSTFAIIGSRSGTSAHGHWSELANLAAKKVVSSSDLDAAQSKFRRLTAVVDQMRSNIRKKAVVAPFDGQLGIRQVNIGQMINPVSQWFRCNRSIPSSPISRCRSSIFQNISGS